MRLKYEDGDGFTIVRRGAEQIATIYDEGFSLWFYELTGNPNRRGPYTTFEGAAAAIRREVKP